HMFPTRRSSDLPHAEFSQQQIATDSKQGIDREQLKQDEDDDGCEDGHGCTIPSSFSTRSVNACNTLVTLSSNARCRITKGNQSISANGSVSVPSKIASMTASRLPYFLSSACSAGLG